MGGGAKEGASILSLSITRTFASCCLRPTRPCTLLRTAGAGLLVCGRRLASLRLNYEFLFLLRCRVTAHVCREQNRWYFALSFAWSISTLSTFCWQAFWCRCIFRRPSFHSACSQEPSQSPVLPRWWSRSLSPVGVGGSTTPTFAARSLTGVERRRRFGLLTVSPTGWRSSGEM